MGHIDHYLSNVLRYEKESEHAKLSPHYTRTHMLRTAEKNEFLHIE